jgi:hypothetical protein
MTLIEVRIYHHNEVYQVLKYFCTSDLIYNACPPSNDFVLDYECLFPVSLISPYNMTDLVYIK